MSTNNPIIASIKIWAIPKDVQELIGPYGHDFKQHDIDGIGQLIREKKFLRLSFKSQAYYILQYAYEQHQSDQAVHVEPTILNEHNKMEECNYIYWRSHDGTYFDGMYVGGSSLEGMEGYNQFEMPVEMEWNDMYGSSSVNAATLGDKHGVKRKFDPQITSPDIEEKGQSTNAVD